MPRLFDFGKENRTAAAAVGFASLALVGMIDYLAPYEINFSVFYLVPISWLAWGVGEKEGYLAAAGAVLFTVIDETKHDFVHPLIPGLNAVFRFAVFSFVVFLLSRLRATFDREKEVARTDALTGAVNRRYFLELVDAELARLKRFHRPFLLVYVDLDHFKAVNDRFGHQEGDNALCAVVKCLRGTLRETDVIARLGGDEFAILLPEMGGILGKVLVSRLQSELLAEMGRHGWPITFSMGALACARAGRGADELIGQADALMYSVKRESGNSVRYLEVGE